MKTYETVSNCHRLRILVNQLLTSCNCLQIKRGTKCTLVHLFKFFATSKNNIAKVLSNSLKYGQFSCKGLLNNCFLGASRG